MTIFKTRTWPLFAVAFTLAILGGFVLSGIVAGILALGAFATFVAACLRGLGVAMTDDPERTQLLGRGGMIGGF